MIRKIICINSVAIFLLAASLCIYPSVRAALDIFDPALQGPGIPKAAWRLYKNLTPRYAAWAKLRVSEGKAESLSTSDISGTEWPLFGSVFYLWGMENLQSAWDAGDHTGGLEPKVFARNAILAASELVIDPKHASWVKKYWGNDYLHKENVFYRMLVIAALTSRENLLHDHAHLEMLRDQVETFSNELNASSSGLLNDYPGECYPGDVMAALMCIKRADAVLGTDHSPFINRALRGFTGDRATRHLLPPYAAIASSGKPIAESRGCGNSYMCFSSPELWPGQAKEWYEGYDKFFWQERLTFAGYREFPKDVPHSDWMLDVDAGPVIAGHGVAACAFGVGAARKNGRFDRAYPLAAEMLASMGELPNGTLIVPGILSNLSDAPLLGEAAILLQLTVQPEKGFVAIQGGRLPGYVFIVLATVFCFGIWRMVVAIRSFRAAFQSSNLQVKASQLQIALWILLILGAGMLFFRVNGMSSIFLVIPALMLPIIKKQKVPKQSATTSTTPIT